jgi:hypothetical protein
MGVTRGTQGLGRNKRLERRHGPEASCLASVHTSTCVYPPRAGFYCHGRLGSSVVSSGCLAAVAAGVVEASVCVAA